MNPILRAKKRVESGWYLGRANRGVSGSPSGSKIGLGAGRADRVDLAALDVLMFHGFSRIFCLFFSKIRDINFSK